MVMSHPSADDGPDEPARAVLDAHDDLAGDRSVGECHHPRPLLHANVRDEAGKEPGMERADVAKRIPDDLRPRLDTNLFADGRHCRCLLGGSLRAESLACLENLAIDAYRRWTSS